MRGVEQIPWLYDVLASLMELRGLGRWRDWLARGAKGRTLEVGAGTGRNLPRYPKDVRLIATEPDLAMVKSARRRAPHVPLVVASAEALPFRDGAFDTVVSSLVFCSVPDPARGLAEVKRVLRPGGALRMMEHVRAETPLRGRWQDFIQPAWTRLAGGCHNNRDTVAAVERAGFVIEDEGRRKNGDLRRFQARPAR